jgi:hypothetical protein
MLVLSLSLTIAALGSAQNLHDPNDQLYRDLDSWSVRGYIEQLPPVRPYPVQLVEALLEKVTQSGDASASARAGTYLEALAKGSIQVHGTARLVGLGDDATPLLEAGVSALFRPEPWLGLSLTLDGLAATREVGEDIRIPGAYSPYPDLVNDNSYVGPFQILQNWNSMASFGSVTQYFQAGFNRGSFGPFFENGTIYGPQAGHAGFFNLVYRGDRWMASILHLALSGSDQFYEGQNDKNNWYPNKHLVLHSFDFMVLPGLEVGFFESVVYGNRLELMYEVPFTNLFHSQSLTGFLDNSYLGADFSWLIQPGLKLLGQVYVDDLGFNSLVTFDFDTKYKLTGQLGLAFVPRESMLESVHLDYTAIMPYMYTHNGDLEPGDYEVTADRTPVYSNYLHMGANLGSDLMPNSDRLSVRTAWNLLPSTRLKLGGELSRHGNASSDYFDTADTYSDDGGFLDDGRDDAGKATYNKTTRFLTQDVIEVLARTSQGLELSVPTSVGTLSLNAECVVEFGWNRSEVGSGPVEGNDAVLVYYSVGTTWSY